ncbi:MAG: hypothetical protein DWQ05_14975 [Calditrichaeota bacterium]|nr:MAG: hypothetical protein DWQ05_14975 [Calditrichota bacterium]
MEREEDKLLDHEYDGIQELDNDLPPWWLNLFYITIVFAFAYTLYYHVFDAGSLQIDEYRQELNPNYEKPAKSTMLIPGYTSPYFTKAAEETPKSMLASTLIAAPPKKTIAQPSVEPEVQPLTPLTDDASLERGSQIYVTNCVACHGVNGEGTIGPNMTDDYWINGKGDLASIVEVITEGRIAKGMIPWKSTLTEQQIMEVGSYLLTLQGTNPANAKAPEGTKVGTE